MCPNVQINNSLDDGDYSISLYKMYELLRRKANHKYNVMNSMKTPSAYIDRAGDYLFNSHIAVNVNEVFKNRKLKVRWLTAINKMKLSNQPIKYILYHLVLSKLSFQFGFHFTMKHVFLFFGTNIIQLMRIYLLRMHLRCKNRSHTDLQWFLFRFILLFSFDFISQNIHNKLCVVNKIHFVSKVSMKSPLAVLSWPF